VAVSVVAAVSTGCAQFSVESLPAPGAGRDSWPLHIDFDTVMNLPTEAKVTVNGLRSGIVTDIAAAPDTAIVTVRLDPSTVVGKHATVGPVSLVMRGESVPDRTRWIGNPVGPWLDEPDPRHTLDPDVPASH
jgi:hypothetical protein